MPWLPVKTAQRWAQVAVLLLPMCGRSPQPSCGSSPQFMTNGEALSRLTRRYAAWFFSRPDPMRTGPDIHFSDGQIHSSPYAQMPNLQIGTQAWFTQALCQI